MPGSFSGINMLGNTLRFFQQGLDVTGHNISNLNTVGYSRQVIQYGANNSETYFGVTGTYQVGTGVGVQGVFRQRNLFLDRQFRDVNSDLGKFQTLSGSLSQIQGIFPEPNGEGISSAITKFFDGWSSLASNPNDPAAKLQLKLAAETLTSRVRTTYNELQTQKAGTESQISTQFDRIDQLSAAIVEVNKQIVAATAGGHPPGDLMDKRDLMLEEMSGLISIQSHVNQDGSVRVYSGEMALVDGNSFRPIPRNYDVASGTISDGNRSYPVTSGSLAGIMQSIQTIDSLISRLDTLANEIKTQVNSIHRTGITADGSTNIDFFADSTPQTGAAGFELSSAVKASDENIVSGASGNAGDGSIALALSKMRDSKFAGIGNKTFSGFYNELLSGVGRDHSAFKDALDTAGAVLTQINNQRQAESGVNLDEELTNMLRYQKSYQAAARALTVFNEVTEELVNLIR